MVIGFRFAHTGKVCSGDYAEEELITRNQYNIDEQRDKYTDYYVREEGDFLYYYVISLLIILLILLLLTCCFGLCLFTIGGAVSLKMLEGLIQNISKTLDGDKKNDEKDKKKEE